MRSSILYHDHVILLKQQTNLNYKMDNFKLNVDTFDASLLHVFSYA